jgi:hypothetical protein
MALVSAVVVKSAGTSVHGSGQHEARGEGQGHRRARNADSAILERLAHDLELVTRELRKLVEKEDAVVSERNFAGTGNHAAADQSSI